MDGRDASGLLPPPWRLQGEAIVRLQRLPADGDGPDPVTRLMQVAPGRTLGGVCLARYGEGSTLRYHELVVFSGLARRGVRAGFVVSHIWVDNPVAAAGGREIWGLPKRLASFRWKSGTSGSEVVAESESDGGALCRIALPAVRHPARLPLIVPVWSRRGERPFRFRVTGTARAGIARGKLDIPASSPFAAFGFHNGPMLELAQLDVRMPAD